MNGPIRSAAYRDGRGGKCTFRIAGVCTGKAEQFAHVRDRHHGGAQKASDTSGGDSCCACHDVFDRRAKLPDGTLISEADYDFYGRRAISETLEDRINRGVVKLPDYQP